MPGQIFLLSESLSVRVFFRFQKRKEKEKMTYRELEVLALPFCEPTGDDVGGDGGLYRSRGGDRIPGRFGWDGATRKQRGQSLPNAQL
jgi:hypothetical protein